MSTPVPWGQHVCYSQSVNGKQPATYYSTWMAAVRRKYPRHRAWPKLRKNHSALESGDYRVQSKCPLPVGVSPTTSNMWVTKIISKIMWDQNTFGDSGHQVLPNKLPPWKRIQNHFYTNVFTHKPVYSKTLLHTNTFTKKPFHTHTHTHTHTLWSTPKGETWDEMRWDAMRWIAPWYRHVSFKASNSSQLTRASSAWHVGNWCECANNFGEAVLGLAACHEDETADEVHCRVYVIENLNVASTQIGVPICITRSNGCLRW